MKLLGVTVFILASELLGAVYAQSVTDSLPNPYQPPIENWGQLPDGRKWGGIGGISFDSKGHLWVFDRCGGDNCVGSDVAPIVEFDTATGKALKSFGAGLFVRPHGIFVDKNDKDNMWVVDQNAKDGKGEQVWKFSADGKALMTLGKAGLTGEGPDTFNDPSGVVVGKDGDIFVSDGHAGRNQTVARIVKFSKDGKFIKAWGKKGSDPGDLDDPHSVTIDSQGRLYVADRGNSRIDIFDQDGKLINMWKQFGIPTGVFVDDKDTLYVADNSRPEITDFKRGIRIGSAKDGKVRAFIEDPDQEPKRGTIGPDNVIPDKHGTLYAGDADRQMMTKYVLK